MFNVTLIPMGSLIPSWPPTFKILSLSSIFFSLIWYAQVQKCWYLFCFNIAWTSCICDFVFVIKFEMVFVIIISNTSFVLYLFFFLYSNYGYYIFWDCPTVVGYLELLSFYLLTFQLWAFPLTYRQAYWFFSQLCPFYWWPHQSILHFVTVFFISNIFLDIQYLCIYYTSVPTHCLFFFVCLLIRPFNLQRCFPWT